MEPSFWTYPGTWIAIVVAVVLVAGGITMAVMLRRILRKPPMEPTPFGSKTPPAPPAPPATSTPSEKNRTHE